MWWEVEEPKPKYSMIKQEVWETNSQKKKWLKFIQLAQKNS